MPTSFHDLEACDLVVHNLWLQRKKVHDVHIIMYVKKKFQEQKAKHFTYNASYIVNIYINSF